MGGAATQVRPLSLGLDLKRAALGAWGRAPAGNGGGRGASRRCGLSFSLDMDVLYGRKGRNQCQRTTLPRGVSLRTPALQQPRQPLYPPPPRTNIAAPSESTRTDARANARAHCSQGMRQADLFRFERTAGAGLGPYSAAGGGGGLGSGSSSRSRSGSGAGDAPHLRIVPVLKPLEVPVRAVILPLLVRRAAIACHCLPLPVIACHCLRRGPAVAGAQG